MTQLSRKAKKQTKKPIIDKEKTKKKLDKGLNAFQRTLAIVGGILGLITASITIYTFMNRNNTNNTNPVQTIIRQIQGKSDTPTSTTPQTEETPITQSTNTEQGSQEQSTSSELTPEVTTPATTADTNTTATENTVAE